MKIKDGIYNYLVRKNSNVQYEYERYVFFWEETLVFDPEALINNCSISEAASERRSSSAKPLKEFLILS